MKIANTDSVELDGVMIYPAGSDKDSSLSFQIAGWEDGMLLVDFAEGDLPIDRGLTGLLLGLGDGLREWLPRREA